MEQNLWWIQKTFTILINFCEFKQRFSCQQTCVAQTHSQITQVWQNFDYCGKLLILWSLAISFREIASTFDFTDFIMILKYTSPKAGNSGGQNSDHNRKSLFLQLFLWSLFRIFQTVKKLQAKNKFLTLTGAITVSEATEICSLKPQVRQL